MAVMVGQKQNFKNGNSGEIGVDSLASWDEGTKFT